METTSVRGDLATLTHPSTAFKVLGAIGFSHLLNDMIQSLENSNRDISQHKASWLPKNLQARVPL